MFFSVQIQMTLKEIENLTALNTLKQLSLNKTYLKKNIEGIRIVFISTLHLLDLVQILKFYIAATIMVSVHNMVDSGIEI